MENKIVTRTGRIDFATADYAHTQEWVRWLASLADTQLILMRLCLEIESVDTTLEDLRRKVDDWRENALTALYSVTGCAEIDQKLGVQVDTRVFSLSKQRKPYWFNEEGSYLQEQEDHSCAEIL